MSTPLLAARAVIAPGLPGMHGLASTSVQQVACAGRTCHTLRRCMHQQHGLQRPSLRTRATPPAVAVQSAIERRTDLPSTSGREEVAYSMFGLSRAVYDPTLPATQYYEQPFDLFALWFLCVSLAEGVGEPLPPGPVGYDTFVQIASKINAGRSAEEQRMLVLGVLLKVIPSVIPPFFRLVLFPSLLNAGFPLYSAMAWGTAPFAGWLVGPSSWEYVEEDGISQRRKVKLKRCRYLEASGCKSQCVNLCKVPTQNFFTNELGLPLTMVPNYEDLSCELIYGQVPPPLEEDTAFQQPCFTGCALASKDKPPESKTGPPACRVI